MLELVVATILLTTLLTVLMPMLKWIQTAESLNSQRQAASELLNNVMEQAAAMSSDQRTRVSIEALLAEGLEELSLHKPLATVTLEVEPQTESQPAAQRIQLSLTWVFDGVRMSSPVKLTAWFH
jgi:type II secretory pathway pseudopilin PulG